MTKPARIEAWNVPAECFRPLLGSPALKDGRWILSPGDILECVVDFEVLQPDDQLIDVFFDAVTDSGHITCEVGDRRDELTTVSLLRFDQDARAPQAHAVKHRNQRIRWKAAVLRVSAHAELLGDRSFGGVQLRRVRH